MPDLRLNRRTNGRILRPHLQKYPWTELTVGETRVVADVPSRGSVYSSLASWRDRVCFTLGLGYTLDNCPQYHVVYDRIARSATIKRLHDGPIAPGRRATVHEVRAAGDPKAKEREWLLNWLDRRHDQIAALENAGQSRGMTPLDIMERARACDPWIAQQMADLDCGGYAPIPGLDVQRIMEEPHNTRPLRRHDDRPDRPHSQNLAYKLANHKDSGPKTA